MKLYLMQHGKAKSEGEDPQEPLTKEGKKDVETVSKAIKKAGISPALIIHSGKTRARQTAETAAEVLGGEPEIMESEDVKPLADPAKAEKFLEEGKDILITGHLPHLSKLCSRLLTGNPEKEIVKFTNAGVLCLEKKKKWMITGFQLPEFLER